MVVATGYFAKAKAYSDNGYALVSIARVAPWFLARGLRLYTCDFLAPTDEILALKDDPSKYTHRYIEEILKHRKPSELIVWLSRVVQQEKTDKVVLMCYESPSKFCHRHLVAKWLSDMLGLKVDEIDSGMLKKEPDLFYEK